MRLTVETMFLVKELQFGHVDAVLRRLDHPALGVTLGVEDVVDVPDSGVL